MNILSFKSKLGWITINEKNEKIFSIKFGKSLKNNKNKILLATKKEIENFINRKLKKFTINLMIIGTPTQKKIWSQIQKIPYGKTKTYGEIAIKSNTSPRYVGKICGQNKNLIVIPCHRVIKKDGSIGGYSGMGGINLKKKLLKIEKYND
tara:strand:+ start:10113 stop:10562 length:450 start_codon:yes stop_codon:yes gene_type:complete